MRTKTEHPPAERSDFDDRLIRALAHPLRHAVLYVLTEREATVLDLVEITRHKRRDVAYHLRVLEECDAIERVEGPQPRGNACYRAKVRPVVLDDAWEQVPVQVRRRILGNALDVVNAHAATALGTGGFDRPDAHLSWTAMDLDEEGYEEIVTLLAEALDRVLAIRAAAEERRQRGAAPAAAIPAEVVMLHFLRDPRRSPAAAGTPPAPEEDSLERLYELTEELADAIPGGQPDWQQVAERAAMLAALARQQGAPLAAR